MPWPHENELSARLTRSRKSVFFFFGKKKEDEKKIAVHILPIQPCQCTKPSSLDIRAARKSSSLRKEYLCLGQRTYFCEMRP